MYENLKVFGVGGFADVFYWSSSEDNANLAWSQNFNFISGTQLNYAKVNTFLVRAVRAF
jgi:hypothetical protein